MSWKEFLFLLPYFLSLLISVSVMVIAWNRRSVRGASIYAWFVASQVLWTFGFICEILTPSLEGKIIWDKIQWVPTFLMAVIFPYFAVIYTNFKLKRPKVFWALTTIVPILFTGLLLSDPWHQLYYPNPYIDNTLLLPDLNYDFTWVIYTWGIYAYIVSFAGLTLLIRGIVRPHLLYRRQIIIVSIGFIIPVVFTILTLVGVQFKPYRDISPITSGLGNILIALGLFRYQLFNVVPIARDVVIDQMEDRVIVLDAQDRIVDINPAAMNMLNTKSTQVIGQHAKSVFNSFNDLIGFFDSLDTPRDISTQISLPIQGSLIHFEIRATCIHDKRGRFIGRVFVARDISDHVNLENSLKDLNRELEKRVSERTEALSDAYDTTLEGWAKALELRDKETEGHSRRVIQITEMLARECGIKDTEMDHIRRGAILHDIGKMAIPDEILQKAGKLTEDEMEIVRQHPGHAFELLSTIPFLEPAIDIPHCHHEYWDGTGYPRGLKGEEIPLSARIFAIVDVWDAVQSNRPYNDAWTREQAIALLLAQSGKMFDPSLVTIFLEMVNSKKI